MIVRVITIVHEFIDKLDDSTQAKIWKCVKSLEEFGPHIGLPCSKKIGPNLYELRALGKIQARLIYSFSKDSAIIIHGFIKKGNKIPKTELELAKQRQRELDL